MNDITSCLWDCSKFLMCFMLFSVLLSGTLTVIIASIKYMINSVKEAVKNENT